MGRNMNEPTKSTTDRARNRKKCFSREARLTAPLSTVMLDVVLSLRDLPQLSRPEASGSWVLFSPQLENQLVYEFSGGLGEEVDIKLIFSRMLLKLPDIY